MATDDKMAALLADVAAAVDKTDPTSSTRQTGRGASGKLRNFKAMNDAKLIDVYCSVVSEANDDEAMTSLIDELLSRGLDDAL